MFQKFLISKIDAQNLDYAHHFVLGKSFVEIFHHLNFRYTIREVFGRKAVPKPFFNNVAPLGVWNLTKNKSEPKKYYGKCAFLYILHNFSEQLFYRALLMVASNSFFFYIYFFRLDFYILTLFWNNASPWQYLIHSCPLQSFLIFPK